jgi:glycosyltransferase involved in cell wall biosynthesis
VVNWVERVFDLKQLLLSGGWVEESVENRHDCNKKYVPTRKIKVIYLSINPNLQGPIPKIDRLLIPVLRDLGCEINTSIWGRHSENETIFQKAIGRTSDIFNAILKLIRVKPDILYIATTLDLYSLARDIPLLLLTKWSPAKKVLMMHGSQTSSLGKPGHNLYKFLTKILVQFSDAILLLSTEELLEWTNFAPIGKYFLVANPCELKSSSEVNMLKTESRKTTCPTLLFVGRLIKAKGVFDLIDAMPMILKKTDCFLLIAGDGECKEEAQRRINESNLGLGIKLLGYVDSKAISDLYKSSNIFLLPTYCTEGFPTVIAEAMSFGLPIITTAIRGTRDYLVNGINALFVPPEDPKAIAESVLRLLGDADLCLLMQHANLTTVQDFKPEIVARRYMEIFCNQLTTNHQ